VSDQEPAAPPPDARLSTGTDALDVMLHGGFVGRRPYLVVGPAGTGKTTLALQFLCDGIRRGERCLIVTLEEPPNEMRMNHRLLLPELDQVYVFDAIPDVMRYERAPFKDIAAVRQAVPFGQVPMTIRKTPELSSVEVTFTALEQTLKMEMARRNFQRIVIDSLTALQYFCMKGFDETLGAQTFLRFLSDLHVTTVLTVEAPLEDSETPERLLARGEIRLFRWEHDSRTVRAIGVEKFRGSEHDGRLHPYRISPRGLDINLALTISRDTQELLPSTLEISAGQAAAPEPPEVFATSLESLEQDSRDLIAVGVDVGGIRSTVLEALAASERSTSEEVARIIARARGRVLEIVSRLGEAAPPDGSASEAPAMRRLRARLAAARMGIPPSGPPDLATLRPMLEKVLDALEPAAIEPRPRPPAAVASGPPPTTAVPTPAATVVSAVPPTTSVVSPITPALAPDLGVSARPTPPPPTSPAAPAAASPSPRAAPGAPPPAAAPSMASQSPLPSPPSAAAPAPASAPPPPPPPPEPVAKPAVASSGVPSAARRPPGAAPAPVAAPAAAAKATQPIPAPPPVVAPAKTIPPPPGSVAPTPPPSPSARPYVAARSEPARPAPPPLPSPGLVEPPRPTAPPAEVPGAPSRAAGSSTPPAGPVVTPPTEAPEASGAPAGSPAPKRRRKAAAPTGATPRKRSTRAAKVPPSAPPTPDPRTTDGAASAPAVPDVVLPTPPPEAEGVGTPEASASKPKKRAPRRKAPPVTAAEPGSPPPEEDRVAAGERSPSALPLAGAEPNAAPPDGG
jgi:KaiC/GvpD/RAD55 family RecA-like ATPase